MRVIALIGTALNWRVLIALLLAGHQPALANSDIQPYSGETLKVMSLNLAHGRKSAFNQMFVSTRKTRNNLDDIARAIKKSGVDVVAFQEADAPSRWSGKFDHVAYLAKESMLPEVVHTAHAQSWMYNYGTALISKLPFTDEVKYTFVPTPPTTNKGFTLGQIAWQPFADSERVILLDLISVHLDFSRKSIRDSQISEMVLALQQRENPVIVMGDFNSDWLSGGQAVRGLAEQTRLHAYRPGEQGLGTFPSSGRRLDWMLISDELEFVDYGMLEEKLSDHLAVTATIRLK